MTDAPISIIDKIETRASILFLRSDGIMHVHFKDIDELLTDDITDAVNGLYGIGGGKKFLIFLTFENFFIIDKEIRKLAATEISGKYTIADAFVVNSIALKLLINFYIAFNKPSRPTRLFDSEEKAVEWLKSFL